MDALHGEVSRDVNVGKEFEVQFSREKICEAFGLETLECELIVENLYRLNLLSAPGSTGIMTGDMRMALKTNDIFELTRLGHTLVEVCSTLD